MNVSRRNFVALTTAAGGLPLLAEDKPMHRAAAAAPGVVCSKTIPVAYEADVFVAGGGPAGVCAALAAARAGKSVFLAETSGAFGGAATASYVPAFAPFRDGVHDIVGGIGREIRDKVSKDCPIDAYWTPIDLEELKRVYDRLVTDAGVRFSFFTSVCDAVAKDGRIDHVILACKRGLLAVRARIYIDCTGDGDMLAFAGGAYEMGDKDGAVMPPTLCSQWVDIDFSQPRQPVHGLLSRAIEDGVFSVPDYHLPGIFSGPHKDSSLGRANVGHMFGVNPTDERSLTAAMIDARRRMPEYERFYTGYVKGYEKARLASTAPFLGIRESRRIVCDYMLNVEDFVKRAVFPDEIGRYCYPVDMHISNPGDRAAYRAFLKEYERDLRYKKGESYGIPYRSLVPKSFSNALVAGRCMGTDRKMQASVRVMPGCFITGQAAGTAAALAVDSGDVRTVKPDELRARLSAAGAYLPQQEQKREMSS